MTLPNGDTHTIRHRVTCATVGVVYLAQCQCGSYYIGKTKRPFQVRIRDHIKPLYKNTTTTAINRHIAAQHNSDPHVILFSALEHVPSHARGGSIDNRLLQLETKWIQIFTRLPIFLGLMNTYVLNPFCELAYLPVYFQLFHHNTLSTQISCAPFQPTPFIVSFSSSSFLFPFIFPPSFPFPPSLYSFPFLLVFFFFAILPAMGCCCVFLA